MSLLNSTTAAAVKYSVGTNVLIPTIPFFLSERQAKLLKLPLFYLHEDWISFPAFKRWVLTFYITIYPQVYISMIEDAWNGILFAALGIFHDINIQSFLLSDIKEKMLFPRDDKR